MKQTTGTQVRKVREMLSISQSYVAKHLGISQAAYSNIENGRTHICREKLYIIARALDVQAEVLVRFNAKEALDIFLDESYRKKSRKSKGFGKRMGRGKKEITPTQRRNGKRMMT